MTIDGGAGVDTVVATGRSLAAASISNVEVLLTNGFSVEGTAAQFEGFSTIRAYEGAENDDAAVYLSLLGSGALDLSDELGTRAAQIEASSFGNTITTGAGSDTLLGGVGDDVLVLAAVATIAMGEIFTGDEVGDQHRRLGTGAGRQNDRQRRRKPPYWRRGR